MSPHIWSRTQELHRRAEHWPRPPSESPLPKSSRSARSASVHARIRARDGSVHPKQPKQSPHAREQNVVPGSSLRLGEAERSHGRRGCPQKESYMADSRTIPPRTALPARRPLSSNTTTFAISSRLQSKSPAAPPVACSGIARRLQGTKAQQHRQV